MLMVFTFCALVGSLLLVLFLAASLLGLEFGHDSALDSFGEVAQAADSIGAVDAHADAVSFHDSSHAFNVLSVRSILAALAFFGLGGRLALAADFPMLLAFITAIGAGVVAMVFVAWIMRLLMSLQEAGTVRLEHAVGLPGTCYLAIPGHHHGAGKITLTLQGRSLELEAVTAGEAIPTGAPVEVVRVIEPTVVEVKPETE